MANDGNSPDYFDLSENNISGGRRSAGSCNDNFLNIQTTPGNDVDNTNYFCANHLATMGGDTTSSRVRGTVSNFNYVFDTAY